MKKEIIMPKIGLDMEEGTIEQWLKKVGDTVKKGQVVAIVEAMKLMNELESDYCGTVKQILVSNGEMVEYGQPLFIVEEQN